ncbi:hypothetical protein [Brenneria uluponensis]|uniref:hypothetical protein n=1 Tax=Brenneria uluponensis TaxID=3057057 RepID=UPI0028EB153A|nr:hypothetical protein [Brenneria ulupoensis]
MTKSHQKRRTAMTRQNREKIQRIARRKSDRVGKALLTTVRCKPMPDLPPIRKTGKKQEPDSDHYAGFTAVGRQKLRGSSTIPRGIY